MEPDDLIIELPYPNKDLMPNRKNGKHWASTKKVKDTAKAEAYILTKYYIKSKQLVTLQGLIPITITYIQSDKRFRDLDNLLAASKPAIDGIAWALNVDDSIFEPITIKRGYAEQSMMKVEL